MLYFLFAGAGLTVLLCAAVPFHLSSRVFFRCDARVAVRALRFFVGVALFLGITEVFAMKPTAEMFFILSFFAFVVEHPKKAARIAGISTALAVLTVELTAAAIGASVCLTTLLVDAAAICCGLFSLAFVRALGLRMPQ